MTSGTIKARGEHDVPELEYLWQSVWRHIPAAAMHHNEGERENGARAFGMAPNSSVLLLDETAPLVWLKTTDGAGYPTLTPYTITPYHAAPPVDVNALEQRIARLEEKLNDKPDPAGNGDKRPAK